MTDAALEELLAQADPVLAFPVAITAVAEIADLAGAFDVTAHWAARVSRNRL